MNKGNANDRNNRVMTCSMILKKKALESNLETVTLSIGLPINEIRILSQRGKKVMMCIYGNTTSMCKKPVNPAKSRSHNNNDENHVLLQSLVKDQIRKYMKRKNNYGECIYRSLFSYTYEFDL